MTTRLFCRATVGDAKDDQPREADPRQHGWYGLSFCEKQTSRAAE
jgi:hypothetical protein